MIRASGRTATAVAGKVPTNASTDAEQCRQRAAQTGCLVRPHIGAEIDISIEQIAHTDVWSAASKSIAPSATVNGRLLAASVVMATLPCSPKEPSAC